MGNKYLRVSTASVKRLPCSLQFQNVLRMFNSKEPSDCKFIQPWDAPVSVTNVEHEPGWHHSRPHHQVSFPPTSLLVLASTRRHANRDTSSKAHWRLCSSNALIVRAQPTDQLSVHLQGCHRTTADLQHCHIWHIRPHPFPPHTSLGSHSFVPIPTRLTMMQVAAAITSTAILLCLYATLHDQPPGSLSFLRVQLLSLLHHSPTISHRCHWRGSTVVEHVIQLTDSQQTHHRLTSCIH